MARDERGRIIGHVGICPGRFEGEAVSAGPVATLHMIDWLGARAHRAVGTLLMRRAHREAATQFVLVANDRARRVTGAVGYAPVAEVPVFEKVLRPGPRLRAPGHGPVGRLVRAARDMARAVASRGERPRARVALSRVETFGDEITPILANARTRAVLNARSPALLNAFLRYPRPGPSGWLVTEGGRLLGLALLNVVPRAGGRGGKIVECLLEGDDPDRWHAAIAALTGELKAQGADTALAYGSTPWAASALRRAGFRARYRLEFTLRDRDGLIPRGATFHLTPMEADAAFH